MRRVRNPLTENVGHLILEVLCGDQGVEQLTATLDHSMNFTTASAKVGIVIECFPQVVDRLATRLGSRIDEDADFRLIERLGGEKPAHDKTHTPPTCGRSR